MSHRIANVRYADEMIECTCGEVITAEPDPFRHDRHGPLVERWAAHRAQHGLKKGPPNSTGKGSPYRTPAPEPVA